VVESWLSGKVPCRYGYKYKLELLDKTRLPTDEKQLGSDGLAVEVSSVVVTMRFVASGFSWTRDLTASRRTHVTKIRLPFLCVYKTCNPREASRACVARQSRYEILEWSGDQTEENHEMSKKFISNLLDGNPYSQSKSCTFWIS
jgi:hypothetical protein